MSRYVDADALIGAITILLLFLFASEIIRRK